MTSRGDLCLMSGAGESGAGTGWGPMHNMEIPPLNRLSDRHDVKRDVPATSLAGAS